MGHTFDGEHKVKSLIIPVDQGSVNSAWVSPFADGGSADRAVFLMYVGTAGGTIDMALYQATDSAGTGRKVITGAHIAQVSAANDEGIVTIEIGPGALDDVNGFSYVRAEVTASSTDTYGVFLIKHRLRYPGQGSQDASYSQQVIVLGQ